MFENEAMPNNPKLRELRLVIAELGEIQAQKARLEALEIQHLSRANTLALSLAEEVTVSGDRDATNRQSFYVQQVQAEIGNVMRTTDRTVARHMSSAYILTREYPALVDAMFQGEISKAHATAISDEGAIIQTSAPRTEYTKEMLTYARSASVNRVRRVAQQVAEKYSDTDAETRIAEAFQGRFVKLQPLDDGLSMLTAVIPSMQGVAIYSRLTQMARRIKQANNRAAAELRQNPEQNDNEALTLAATDIRTLMQIRSDLLLDIALTGFPTALNCENGSCDTGSKDTDSCDNDRHGDQGQAHNQAQKLFQARESSTTTQNPSPDFAITNEMLKNITAHVQIVMPMFSLLPREHIERLRRIPELTELFALSGMNGTPHLTGHGPVPPDVARLLLGTSTSWDRLLTDPIQGTVITADQYQPTASLRRLLVARDLHCRFPGCRIPTRQCEVDHTRDWALGGKTVPENLAHLCLRHHTLKHHSDWKVEQLPGGVMKWTSPLGKSVLDEPVSTVVFKSVTEHNRQGAHYTQYIQEGPATDSEAAHPPEEDEPPPF